MSCICGLLDKPTYHVRDNPHSINKRWDCPEHGHQERYWLIHQERETYCVPCQKELSWGEAKKNLLTMFEKSPNIIGGLLDSAYLHGLESNK